MKKLIPIALLGMNMAVMNGQILQKTGTFTMDVSSSGNLPPEASTYIDGISTMYYTLPDRKVNGSPYLQDDFIFGVMKTVDTVTIEGLRFRYDVYHDEMQFILKNDTASIIRPLTLISLEFGSVKFVYDVFLDDGDKAAAGYFEVLEQGGLTALLKRTKELEFDEYLKNYGGGGGSKEFYFREKEQLYIRYKDALARKITNNREFLALLRDHRDEMKDFMKSNRLSARKQDDLVRMVSYYNELGTN